jgi:hypothetical protein
MSGGEHSTDVIRQRQQRAHRNVHLTTRSCRRQIVGCRYRSRRRPGYSSFPAIWQPNDDQPRSPPRASTADRKALAVKGMVRINHPYLSDSPVKRCGIPKCSVIPLLAMRSWTASFTTPIASSYAANHCAERKLRRTPWLDPNTIQVEISAKPTGSATPADIDRNGRPTSIGIGGRLQAGITGRLHRNAQWDVVMQRCPDIPLRRPFVSY